MTQYPKPLTQRAKHTSKDTRSRLRTLEARTAGIDSGFPLMTLPAVIDSGYSSGNPMAYVNGSATLTGPYACLASYTPLAADAVLLQPIPASRTYVVLGLSGPRPWQQITSLANGWGFGSGGFLKYRLTGDDELQLVGTGLAPGTAADGTAIVNSGGLPSRYCPPGERYVPAFCDRLAAYSGVSEAAGIAVKANGEIDCYGVSGTATRLDFSFTLPLTA